MRLRRRRRPVYTVPFVATMCSPIMIVHINESEAGKMTKYPRRSRRRHEDSALEAALEAPVPAAEQRRPQRPERRGEGAPARKLRGGRGRRESRQAQAQEAAVERKGLPGEIGGPQRARAAGAAAGRGGDHGVLLSPLGRPAAASCHIALRVAPPRDSHSLLEFCG
jgi:hypothetical protein